MIETMKMTRAKAEWVATRESAALFRPAVPPSLPEARPVWPAGLFRAAERRVEVCAGSTETMAAQMTQAWEVWKGAQGRMKRTNWMGQQESLIGSMSLRSL